MDFPWYKTLGSYLFPITLLKPSSVIHKKLKIQYFRGQIQLESDTALYSDGDRYAPFRLGFNYLYKKKELQNIKKFLLLGAGLGSALHRLQRIYQLYPSTYLVEYDEAILALSKQFLLPSQKKNVHFICTDARKYTRESKDKFDLIGIDLFEQLRNSPIIYEVSFWLDVKKLLSANGHVIVNTIFIKKIDRTSFEKLLSKAFTFERIVRNPNYIYILKLKA